MAKTIFGAAAFRPMAAQNQVALRPHMGDILSDALQDLNAIDQEVMKLISGLPVELVGQFSARRDACLKQSVLTRYTCLYELARDIEKAISSRPATPPTTPTPTPAPASTFPIVPVAIGGAVLLAGIIYLVLKKK